MIWVRRGITLGRAIVGLLALIYVFLVGIAETASAQVDPKFGVGEPITVEAPETVSRVGDGCAEQWSPEWCASGAALALCEARAVFCDVVSIETRPVEVGGFTAGDEFPSRPVVPDALLWAVWMEPGFEMSDHPWAVAAAMCESGGDQYAKNPGSSASGWWQHLMRFVPGRLASVGLAPDTDFWRADVQAIITAALYGHGHGASHWNPSRHCWRKYQ